MTPKIAHDIILPACLKLFAPSWSTPAAVAMLLAIGLQESEFEHRQQLIGAHRKWWEAYKGPAQSFWQIERPCIQLLINHHATNQPLQKVCMALGYPVDASVLHEAIRHNDILAACLARLLLRTCPQPLPLPQDIEGSWNQYIGTWRPGKPRRETWMGFYTEAWLIVMGEES